MTQPLILCTLCGKSGYAVPPAVHRCETPRRFAVGTVYTTGEGRDYIWRFLVIKRTAKFITVRDIATGDVSRCGVRAWNGSEYANPLGSYSMAPSIDAATVYNP